MISEAVQELKSAVLAKAAADAELRTAQSEQKEIGARVLAAKDAVTKTKDAVDAAMSSLLNVIIAGGKA